MMHLALDAMVLSRRRLLDAGLRENCALPPVIGGGRCLRAENGVTYVYNIGASVRHTGVISEVTPDRFRI